MGVAAQECFETFTANNYHEVFYVALEGIY